MLAVDNQAKIVPCQGFPLRLYILGRVTQAFWTPCPWKHQNWQKWQSSISQKKITWHFLSLQPIPNFSVGSASPWGGNIQTICINMTTTEKIVQSYLDYISTPNVHFECFFTSVTLHINVWYWKIWWANYAVLPIFILHSHFWTQFLKFYLLTPTEDKYLNWGNANSIVTFVELRKKQEHAFLSILIQMWTVRLISWLS